MNKEQKVCVLPDPLSEGWTSMNHYWASLYSQYRKDGKISFILGEPALGLPRKDKLTRLWIREIWYRWKLRKAGPDDVFHLLDHSYADLIRFLPAEAKKIVTVHDLIPLTDDSTLPSSQRERFLKRVNYLKKADLLLCVSEFTANEVHRILGIPTELLRVIPMGVDEEYLNLTETKEKVFEVPEGRKPLLVVGSAVRRKNLQIFPDIMRELPKDEYTIVKVGKAFPSSIAERIKAEGGDESLVEVGFVAAETLPHFYAQSFALVFPSYMEGFGLPVLEAMAVGCPVVCSNRASLPEVGGDCVSYFDPDSPEEAAKALKRLASDQEYRERMVLDGRARARTMTWSTHVEKLREVYRLLDC